MEVGPTTHYIMGGVRVDADTQMSNVPGLFAAGECAAGINGANRLGGNSLSDILVFGKRAGEYAAKFAEARRAGADRRGAGGRRGRRARSSRSTAAGGEGPYQVQYALQEMMQDLVGIVRNEDEMQRALDGLAAAARAGRQRRRRRPSRVQPGLARGARPSQPADGLGGDHALGDRAQGKPRRPLPRRLSRTRMPRFAHLQHRRPQGAGWRDGALARADPGDAGRAEADHRGDEVDGATSATFRSGAAMRAAASSGTTRPTSPKGWSCSTPCTRSRPSRRNDLAVRWNCKAGKCGSCSAEVTASRG